jgi:uncharacterized membrane protein
MIAYKAKYIYNNVVGYGISNAGQIITMIAYKAKYIYNNVVGYGISNAG